MSWWQKLKKTLNLLIQVITECHTGCDKAKIFAPFTLQTFEPNRMEFLFAFTQLASMKIILVESVVVAMQMREPFLEYTVQKEERTDEVCFPTSLCKFLSRRWLHIACFYDLLVCWCSYQIYLTQLIFTRVIVEKIRLVYVRTPWDLFFLHLMWWESQLSALVWPTLNVNDLKRQ